MKTLQLKKLISKYVHLLSLLCNINVGTKCVHLGENETFKTFSEQCSKILQLGSVENKMNGLNLNDVSDIFIWSKRYTIRDTSYYT